MPSADDGPPLAAVPQAPVGRGIGTASDAGGRFLLAAVAALLLARIPVIFLRAFDPDEFEHAHAAWSVWKGLLLYRDFFEHHTPWYYFLLAPFFRFFAVDQGFEQARHFLIFGRLLSLALTALSVVLVFLVGRLGTSRRLGLLAALLFVQQPVLLQKTLEIRPDVPALALFMGALWFLHHGLCAQDTPRPRLRWFVGGGLCIGAAIMCTQKMLFVVPGALTGLVLWTLAGTRRAFVSRGLALLVVLVGIALPAAVTWIGFVLHGGGRQFVINNFLLNAHWRVYTGRHVAVVLRTGWPLVLLGLVGAWSALSRSRRAEQRAHGDVLLLCIFAGLVGGLLVIPAAQRQYYLPVLAIACLFAARGLAVLLDASRHHARAWLVVGAAAPLLLWAGVDLVLAGRQRNDVQMARLRFVFAHTAPADAVLDGWLGTNVFRPHPHYYFFMHGELLAMLTDPQRDAYVDALMSARARPALITLDKELQALGPRFMQFVEQNYVSSDGLFYLPAPASPPGHLPQ